LLAKNGYHVDSKKMWVIATVAGIFPIEGNVGKLFDELEESGGRRRRRRKRAADWTELI
jgi:hypothetical protein